MDLFPSSEAPVYRAFRLDRQGRVCGAEVLDAADDEEAKRLAGALVNGHGLLLFERARHLADYPPRVADAGSNAAG